jgi:hypothetical protein
MTGTIGWTRESGTNTSSATVVMLPVPRMPDEYQSSMISRSDLGARTQHRFRLLAVDDPHGPKARPCSGTAPTPKAAPRSPRLSTAHSSPAPTRIDTLDRIAAVLPSTNPMEGLKDALRHLPTDYDLRW